MNTINQSRISTQAIQLKKPLKIRHFPVKRAFDIFFSFLILIALSPLYFLISLAIIATSKGKPIYAHERIGRGGKPFKCYKFRTMYGDSDKILKEILESDPLAREEWKNTYKIKNDPRITPIGKLLRKSSLDELPQFWNVLKGDLSVVGPRPVIKEEINQYFGVKAYKILSIRPGLTGLWQVSGRSDISYASRIKFDETYVDTQSMLLDLKLILKTIPCMINSKGAY